MSEEERNLFDAVDLILTPAGERNYRFASHEEKEKMSRRLWKQRDPLFLSDVNERKLEHYGRVAYANLRFSRPQWKAEGWKSDQGQAYIRYGAPESHYKTRPSVSVTPAVDKTPEKMKIHPSALRSSSAKSGGIEGDAGAASGGGKMSADFLGLNFSRETWNYPGFSLTFVDRSFTGNYRHSNTDYYRLLVKKMPDRYDFLNQTNYIPISSTQASFKNNRADSELDVYESIPEESVWFLENRSKYDLNRGVFLFDLNCNETKRIVNERIPLFLYDNSLLLFGWNRLITDPGLYQIVVELYEPETKVLGRWIGETQLDAYNEQDLAMSDVILAREIGEYQETDELRRGGQRIMPNTLELYNVGSLVPIYFEVYNLNVSPEGWSHYRVTFTVESGEKKKGIGQWLKRLVSGPSSGRVVTSFDYRGTGRTESVFQALELEKAEARDYRLTIEVTDLIAGRTVMKERVFGLREIVRPNE
jgi:GWxTD domain-containing protein